MQGAEIRRGIVAALTAVLLTLLAATPASAWWNDNWALRKKITIDTSATGAAINDEIGGLPALVRLHAGNFRFAEAKEDGADLVFVSGDDKTPLKFHIEKFDPLLNEALVWVRVPSVKPGEKTEIWLYYKNEKAQSAADAKNTYDPNALIVYHFAERGTPPQDSSTWANHASTPGKPADGAIVGTGLLLDGQTPLSLPATPALAIPLAGDFTWSAWIRPDSLQRNAVIYSRREGANALIIGLDDGAPFVEVTTSGAAQRSALGAPVAPGGWHHLAASASPGLVTLYLDGAPYASLNASLPALNTAATLGADTAPPTPPAPADPAAPVDPAAPASPAPAPAASGMTPFAGAIDELNLSKTARPAGFIRAQAVGEGPENQKLLVVGGDEETASWISGHFAIILNSVTIDGWVVIALLGVMAVVSWFVIVRKAGYTGRQKKANRRFLAWLDAREASGDGDPSEAADLPKGRAARDIVRNSSIYRLHAVGAEQIRRRAAATGGRLATLSPQSIAAIRSAMETKLLGETQRLNGGMTVLTISISGGPYLGLLGTVVGVMITFAAIAESGDVNINAIAPGVAAALVATVAGLAVAIPALFAYNFLSGRIRDLSTDMHVFVDSFTTRLAETYQAAAKPRPIAAE
jgi:biopolymer transport protein ExbB